MGNLPFSCEPPQASLSEVTQEGICLSVHADLIFSGGTIITMDDSKPTVEAVAVKDETIMAVGTMDEISKLNGPFTRVVELKGTETLMPGLIEPHTHPSLVASLSIFTDLSGFTYSSFEEVKKAMKDKVNAKKPSDPLPWILFRGWDPALIPDLPPLDAMILDSLTTTEYPVLVMNQALHSAWLNSKGLATCNITSETKDPEGGKIVRDQHGNPTGMLKEAPAITLVFGNIPKPSMLVLAKLVFDALQHYSRNGFTTVTDMGTIPFDLMIVAFLSFITLCPECPVRLGAYYTPASKMKPAIQHVNKKLWFPGVKIWADGSPYAGSMAVAKPYLKTPMSEALNFDFEHFPCGYLIYPSADAQAATIKPFQDELIATHCHGERAIEQTLDAYEQLIQSNPGNFDHRYRLDHTGLITEEQLRRATQLGITVTMFVNHVYYYGVALRDGILGADRAERFAPTHLATTSGRHTGPSTTILLAFPSTPSSP